MCGIAGIVSARGDVVDAGQVRRMCGTMVHRGPDDEGIYTRGSATLGIRRLSVIDVAGGHQPLHNEDKSIWVVCNGEIYNHPELRKELQGRGHAFYTRSDAEAIVHLYEELGPQCVQRLRGMFAFAVYDQRSDSLLLARDRLGKKPLHYAWRDGKLMFASEIKALLAADPGLMELNPGALLQYLQFGYIPDPHSAFQDIGKLPPGHLLKFAKGQVEMEQYWDVPEYGTAPELPEKEHLDEGERRLTEAVRMRLISDVPLGALLSGGVDSSLIVALMARTSSQRVKTFSIGFEDDEYDESRYARLVAQRFETEHHELVVRPNIEETLEGLTRGMEEPFGDSSAIPTFQVSRMARQHVTVALSGDGADELFAGYDRYAKYLQRERFDQCPSWVGRWFRRRIYPKVPAWVKGRRLLFHASLEAGDRYIDSISHLPLDRERGIYSDELLEWAGNHAPWNGSQMELRKLASTPDVLSQLLYLDTKTYLPGDLLTKVDRMSMANSLEVRCPLLDHAVVEWAATLPSEWKLRGESQKYLLKKLAARLGVPGEALHRPKRGFAMPLAKWWQQGSNEILSVLTEPKSLQRGYFKATAIRELVEEHRRGRRDRSYDLWILLVFELWQRNFLEGRGCFPNAAMLGQSASRARDARFEAHGKREVAC